MVSTLGQDPFAGLRGFQEKRFGELAMVQCGDMLHGGQAVAELIEVNPYIDNE